jgi:hypothetical protein
MWDVNVTENVQEWEKDVPKGGSSTIIQEEVDEF